MIALHEVTLDLLHEYYRGFENDPDIFMDMAKYSSYRYDADQIDARYSSRATLADRKEFIIVLGDKPIGEISLKRIDCGKKECTLSIHLQNDSVKNKGYGTQAEKLAVKYAFDVMNMQTVLADSVLKNTRSQHVLEKVGFDFVKQEGVFRYYRLTRAKFQSLY